MADLESARAAKGVLTERLGDDDRVTSIGIARNHGNFTVKVGLADEHDRPDLPEEINGVSIETEIVGHACV